MISFLTFSAFDREWPRSRQVPHQSDARHAQDLSSGSQQDRQQHPFPRRPEDVSVNQLPAEFLLSVFAGVDLETVV